MYHIPEVTTESVVHLFYRDFTLSTIDPFLLSEMFVVVFRRLASSLKRFPD